MSTPRTTPRTDAELLRTPSLTYLARTLEIELAAVQAECLEQARLLGISGSREASLIARLEKAETELAIAKQESDLDRTRIASIFWSGVLDTYTGWDVQMWAAEYAKELTRLRARAEKAEERLKWLEGFLQAGGTSINTVSHYTVENHPDDTDETHFNFPFQIGISVERENRGCYEWIEFSNGAKGICPAIDAAKIKYDEWRNQIHKGD